MASVCDEFEDRELVEELGYLANREGSKLSADERALIRAAAARLVQLTGVSPARTPHSPLVLKVAPPRKLDFKLRISVNEVGSRLLIEGPEDVLFLSPESVQELKAYLRQVLPEEPAEEPSQAERRDAARWRALIGSAYIASIGSMDLAYGPEHAAHLQVSLWSTIPEGADPQSTDPQVIRDLKRYARVSARARKAAQIAATAQPEYDYRVRFEIHSNMHPDDTDPVCTDTMVVKATDEESARQRARTQVENHRCWDERIHPWMNILAVHRQD